MNLKNAIMLIFFLMLSGCAGKQYRWKNTEHSDTNRFHRENAECQLIAKSAASGIQSNRSLSYTATTYNYGSYQTTHIQPNQLQEALDDINTGIQQYVEESEVYELCMESKGYYQVDGKNVSNRRKSTSAPRRERSSRANKGLGRTGSKCRNTLDCGNNLFCSRRRCVSYNLWLKDVEETSQTKKHKNCKSNTECPGDDMCGDISKKCVSLDVWEKELDEKYRRLKNK